LYGSSLWTISPARLP